MVGLGHLETISCAVAVWPRARKVRVSSPTASVTPASDSMSPSTEDSASHSSCVRWWLTSDTNRHQPPIDLHLCGNLGSGQGDLLRLLTYMY